MSDEIELNENNKKHAKKRVIIASVVVGTLLLTSAAVGVVAYFANKGKTKNPAELSFEWFDKLSEQELTDYWENIRENYWCKGETRYKDTNIEWIKKMVDKYLRLKKYGPDTNFSYNIPPREHGWYLSN